LLMLAPSVAGVPSVAFGGSEVFQKSRDNDRRFSFI
jgi:hypothetical protein